MTMGKRDPLVAEWANTIRVEEVPRRLSPKILTFHANTQGTRLLALFSVHVRMGGHSHG